LLKLHNPFPLLAGRPWYNEQWPDYTPDQRPAARPIH
jgi:hypothetical protein